MNQSIQTFCKATTCVLICASLSNCIIIAKTSDQTTGRKLTDLKTAYDKGAISKSEYEAQKSTILDKN